MSHEHDHDHEHEEVDVITLVNEQGEETLYEIILTIDGEEAFDNKQYILIVEAGLPEDEETDVLAFSYTENEDGTQGELKPVETDEEWDMIEDTFNTIYGDDAVE